MIAVEPKNIDWLRERLHECKRECEAVGIANPTFVLLTKDKADRERVENQIVRHYAVKYGELFFKAKQFDIGFGSQRIGTFSFPDIGVTVVLMEIDR